MWFVYLVQCSDGSLYTGVTTDVDRRIREHNGSDLGARYTRARRPVVLVYVGEFASRSLAMSEEARIKKLERIDKLRLVEKAG